MRGIASEAFSVKEMKMDEMTFEPHFDIDFSHVTREPEYEERYVLQVGEVWRLLCHGPDWCWNSRFFSAQSEPFSWNDRIGSGGSSGGGSSHMNVLQLGV